jgi:hypothetical protein
MKKRNKEKGIDVVMRWASCLAYTMGWETGSKGVYYQDQAAGFEHFRLVVVCAGYRVS